MAKRALSPDPTGKQSDRSAREKTGSSAPARAITRQKRSWAWAVVLILAAVIFGGGYGAIAVTNIVATSGYAGRLGAAETVGGLTIAGSADAAAVPIVVGTSWEALRDGIGWYESTARPGEYGNCALAGHRLGWGQPFANLASLEVGDAITIQTSTATYTYRVITAPTVVDAAETDILAPVPGDPSRVPTKALLTLTTAASILPSPNRLVVIAELVPG